MSHDIESTKEILVLWGLVIICRHVYALWCHIIDKESIS